MKQADEHEIIAQNVLSQQRLARAEEARHLALTRQKHIEESIVTVLKRQEWLKSYQIVLQQLNQHHQALQDARKVMTANSDAEQELARFEAFENVQPNFLRMQMLAQRSLEYKKQISQLTHALEQANQQVADATRSVYEREMSVNDNLKILLQSQNALSECLRNEGRLSVVKVSKERIKVLFDTLREYVDTDKKELQKTQANITQLTEKISSLKTRLQGFQPHRHMLKHGEVILERLDQLDGLSQEMRLLRMEYDKATKAENDANEMLMRVLVDYRNLENEVRTLSDELTIHRHNNAGQTSYALQERAMRLQIRQTQLRSALFLWNQIAENSQIISEKQQVIQSLAIRLSSTQREINNQTAELDKTRAAYHDKEQKLILSKSQNVMHLRMDLQEGYSCSVCGATHHPYHSDTMLEHSRRTDSMQLDCDEMAREIEHKAKKLEEQKLIYAKLETEKQLAEDDLKKSRERQNANLKAWEQFAHLDPSFVGNSDNINHEGRLIMINQLIENTIRDSDIAQRELDDYNFHQGRQNELSEQHAKSEAKLKEVTVRLNEVNTGCQVMAGRAERTSQLLNTAQTKFTQVYEKLTHDISLAEWYKDWQANPESVKLRIKDMLEQWEHTKLDLAAAEHEHALYTQLHTEQDSRCKIMSELLQHAENDNKHFEDISSQIERSQQHSSINGNASTFFEEHYNKLKEAIESNTKETATLMSAKANAAQSQGNLDTIISVCERIDQDTAKERSLLDIWIHKYNATNPPVQYAELNNIFLSEKDWNAAREQIREYQIRAIIEQEKVNELQNVAMSMETAPWSVNTTNYNEAEQQLEQEKESLNNQLKEVLMQITELNYLIQKHNESVSIINEQ